MAREHVGAADIQSIHTSPLMNSRVSTEAETIFFISASTQGLGLRCIVRMCREDDSFSLS